MEVKGRTLALVPLRGGSKSIPGKNIRLLGGVPLCAWVLRAATACNYIQETWVSTDSPQIAAVVSGLGLGVRILERPANLATDEASTESVMEHFAAEVGFDRLVTIQATSPLLEARHLSDGLEACIAGGFDSMLSGTRTRRFFWSLDGKPLNYDPASRPLRQKTQGCIMENGAFYITSRKVLEETGCRLGGRIGVYEMEEETGTELDEPADWAELERRIAQRRDLSLSARLAQIQVLALDVDGTLTDGAMWYGPAGELAKRFNTRDGFGLERLHQRGLLVWLLTGEDSPIVMARARKLGIRDVVMGARDKAAALRALCMTHGVEPSRVAYLGDDLNDLPCLEVAGFFACPADASPEVLARAHWVLRARGGHGAVREFSDELVAVRDGDADQAGGG